MVPFIQKAKVLVLIDSSFLSLAFIFQISDILSDKYVSFCPIGKSRIILFIRELSYFRHRGKRHFRHIEKPLEQPVALNAACDLPVPSSSRLINIYGILSFYLYSQPRLAMHCRKTISPGIQQAWKLPFLLKLACTFNFQTCKIHNIRQIQS